MASFHLAVRVATAVFAVSALCAAADPSAGPERRPEEPAPRAATSPDGPAAYDPAWRKQYPQQAGDELQPFPEAAPGDIVPQELYRYTGRSAEVYATIDRGCATNL